MKTVYKICIISSWDELADFVANQLTTLTYDVNISDELPNDLNAVKDYDILFLYVENEYVDIKAKFIAKIQESSEFSQLVVILIASYTKEVISKIVSSNTNYYDQIIFLPVSNEVILGSIEIGIEVKNRRLKR